MLYKVDPAFQSVDGILSVTTQMKATEEHFAAVLYKVDPGFESVDALATFILWLLATEHSHQ